MPRSQSGHGVRKTNWPFWKMPAGYLNRISNMKSTWLESRDRCMDVTEVAGSYRQPQIAGKFNKRAHFREALVCEKHSTRGAWGRFFARWSALRTLTRRDASKGLFNRQRTAAAYRPETGGTPGSCP